MGVGLQQMFCCLTASTARALLCMADAEFEIQVIVEAVVPCPKPEHCHLFSEIQAADLTQAQYADTGPTSPSIDPITAGVWQGFVCWLVA